MSLVHYFALNSFAFLNECLCHSDKSKGRIFNRGWEKDLLFYKLRILGEWNWDLRCSLCARWIWRVEVLSYSTEVVAEWGHDAYVLKHCNFVSLFIMVSSWIWHFCHFAFLPVISLAWELWEQWTAKIQFQSCSLLSGYFITYTSSNDPASVYLRLW